MRALTFGLCGVLVLGALLLTHQESTAHAQSLTPGLVAAYSFDEGTGTTVADASGTGNGGTIGTATWSTLGKNGNALSFNGSSARVTIPDAPSLRLTAGMTLEAWVFPTTVTGRWRDVVFKGDDNYYLMATTPVGSAPGAGGIFSGSYGETFGASALPANTWSHLGATYDGATLRLYVNGVQVASRAQTGTLATSANPLNIGGDTFYNQYFSGRIDDVRVYNTALTAVEIQSDMNNPVGPSGPPDPTPPSAPGTLTATASGSSSVNLSWGAATDNVAVTNYRVERCQGSGCTSFTEIAAAGSTQYSDTTVTGGTTYRYRVRAADGSGNLGPYSNIASATSTNTAGFANDTVATSLDFVTTMRFLPDGKKLVGEIGGTLRVIPVGASVPSATPFNVIDGAVADADAGLHDIALDPNFATNGFYYVHYAHTQGSSYRDRLSRFTAAPGWTSTVAGSELVLWQDDASSTTGAHHGASIAFGPDGKLYLSMGDNGSPADAQSLTNYHGKILRFNPDGTIPSDNPFVDGTGGNKDQIWAYGLRNPYRMSFDFTTGVHYVGDVGGNDNSTAYEEINVIERGKNYGWPLCEGPCSITGVTGPMYSYPHAGRDAAIMGGFVYRGDAYPASYRGNYFFADYAQNWIRRLTLDATGKVVTGVFNFEPATSALDTAAVGDPVWLGEGPDGSLYYLDLSFAEQQGAFNDGTLRRMRYLGTSNQPPMVVANGNPLEGQPPLNVSFSSAGTSDPDGDSLTYAWDFGDGASSTAPNPSHSYTARGRYAVTLTVSDGTNSSFANLTVVVGSPPVGQIVTPTDGALFVAGDHIPISGSGTDTEDGTLPASAYSWSVVFHHEGHQHPAVGPINGVKNLTFDIPTSGHDFSGFTRYEIILTVTDSDGLTHRSSVFVFPDKVTQTFDTVPSGLTLEIDGISKTTPFSIEEVKGFQHTLNAPSQTSGGTLYAFGSWSDGGTQSHTIVTPNSNQSYVATFQATGGPSPVAAYGFEQGSGTTLVDSAGTNNGAINGATWTTAGQYGSALSFNGTSDFVNLGNPVPLRITGSMTWSAWVFATGTPTDDGQIISKSGTSSGTLGWQFKTSPDTGPHTFAVGVSGTGTTTTQRYSTTTRALNTWYHVAGVYDATAQKLDIYVNGVLDSSVLGGGPIPASQFDPVQNVMIGRRSSGGFYFQGRIDELRVYNVAVSQAKIQADMNTPVSAPPADTTVPTAPASLTATPASSSQVNLSWAAAADNIAVTGYRVERCQDATCTTFSQIAATGTGTTYNDTTVDANTTYRYRVRATDAAGNLGPYSPIASATTPAASDTTVPTAPASLTATPASSSQVNLSWAAAADNIAVTGYRVERCQDATCTTFSQIAATGTGTTYNDTTVDANTTYRYRVRATDAAGNLGPYSPIANATTPTAPPAGLVAAYSFDEGTGTTVADASGTGNGGAIGTATWSTLGKNGNALSFNGTSARVTVPDAPSLRLTNAMTLEAWVFPTKRSTVWRDVIFKGDDYFLMSSTHVSSRPAVGGNFSGTNAYLNGPSALTSNRWTHLAATYDGTTLRLYVNGAQVATRSQTGTLATSSNPLNIGGDTIYNQYFAGRIDDVRLYNTARSAVQIQADMNAPVTPPTQSVSSIADSATISEESASPTESATTNQAGTGDSPAGEETKGTEQETDSGNEGANSQETIASERTEASGIGRTQTDTDNSRDTGTNSDSGTNESTGTNEEPGGGVTSSPDTR